MPVRLPRFLAVSLCVAWTAAMLPASPSKVPSIEIGRDVRGLPVNMPLVGYLATNESGVALALRTGYRLFDTALTYGNQRGIARAIATIGIPRDAVFISTKVPGGLGTAGTIAAHHEDLKQLEMDRVDLLLTHYPCGFPTSPGGKLVNCTKAARQATWRGLEALYKSGKARAIGVAHYCQQHLEDILEIATVDIAVDREEWHIGMGTNPRGLAAFCRKHRISYQSSSPLCGNCAGTDHSELISGPLVTSIGKAHNISGAQVALKWLVQLGSPVTPGTTNPNHLRDNLELFEFMLSETEMRLLSDANKPEGAELPFDCKQHL